MYKYVLRIYAPLVSGSPIAHVCEHRPGWMYLVIGNTRDICSNYRVGDSSESNSQLHSMRRSDGN